MLEKKENDFGNKSQGRFAWVRKLLQSKNSTLSLRHSGSSSNHPKQPKSKLNSNKINNESSLSSSASPRQERNTVAILTPTELRIVEERETESIGTTRAGSQKENSINLDARSTKTTLSGSKSFKSSSMAQESILTKPDNISTVPVVSLSTISVRSSTFSENSQQSTSCTVTSEHPTLFTNASTVGIPPASIFDRRENRGSYQPFSINSSYYSTNNNSNHTINTRVTPGSVPVENHDNN